MPSLSEAFRGHPVHLEHKHPDFKSLETLPDSYAWSQSQFQPCSNKCSVPVIDMKHPKAPSLVGHACKTWGVFQVVNHDIPITLFADMQRVTLALFSLPLLQKLKAARSPHAVSGFGSPRISSFFPKLMWSDDIVVDYQAAMEKLAGKLMCLVLASLGISKGDIKWAGPRGEFDGACAALHLNSYPCCPDPDRALGLAAHTDSTLLTILHQNNVNGLEVLKEGEGWVAVPPLPGGLVVNVGDLLHILSNGLYPSVLHRARVNRTQHRLSVAYLYGPPTNVIISPHGKLVGPTRPALYRSVSWNEYLGTKAEHFNKALSSVRLNGLFDANEDQKNDDFHSFKWFS
ncbi:hypothetical protein Fmac_012553 [Flemingia macrophylla]|uniref:Fe2OG dioxygenase domain-containing protein n=1 Tax=Flemingia macrophylla TaxID=520843 RepID=A0ABD1MQM9_9FABA